MGWGEHASALEHPIQQQAYDLVRAAPGLSFHELADLLNVSKNSAEYHIFILERESPALLVRERVGRESRIFPNLRPYTAHTQSLARFLQMAEHQKGNAILSYFAEHESVRSSDLEELEICQPAHGNYYFRLLCDSGLVEREKIGREYVYRTTKQFEEAFNLFPWALAQEPI